MFIKFWTSANSMVEVDHSFDVEKRRGTLDLHLGFMGAGKSLIAILIGEKILHYTRYNTFVARHRLDTKAGEGQISSRGGLRLSAEIVDDAQDFYDRIKKADKERGFQDVIIGDESLYYGWPIISILMRLASERRAIIFTSLLGTSKGELIPLVEALRSLPMTTVHLHSAYCQADVGGRPCSELAVGSLKLYADKKGSFRICHERKPVDRNWRIAEYWTSTVEPQEHHNPMKIIEGGAFYIAASQRHFILPEKEETFKVLQLIKTSGKGISAKELKRIMDHPNLEKMLDFLSNPDEARGVYFDKSSELYRFIGPA